MESFEPEKHGEVMHVQLGGLFHELEELTGEELHVEKFNGTYEIEGDSLTLTFTIDDEFFEIRSIDVHRNAGLGHQVINAIHEFADEYGLLVIASNVLDTARGFWEKMGYQEGAEGDEFFRPS